MEAVEILSPETLARFRAARRCELCHRATPWGCHPHHVQTKGMGGGSRLDVPINLISICWQCHGDIHAGRIPEALRGLVKSFGALLAHVRQVVADREGRSWVSIQEEIWELKRRPKGGAA